MPKKIPQLSALMPAYNEEEVLPLAIAEAVEALDEISSIWELVIVDDGSTDRTAEVLREWAGRDERVRPVTQEHNSGYTKALIRGFGECRYQAIFYTDADAQFDLRHILRLYPFLEEADMVTGYRIDRQDGRLRNLTSAVYNQLQGWVLGVRVRDVNCAFKLFRKSFFDRVQLSGDGFLIDAELYARAQKEGLTWKQVGVPHRPRQQGTTTVGPSTIFETLRELRTLAGKIARGD